VINTTSSGSIQDGPRREAPSSNRTKPAVGKASVRERVGTPGKKPLEIVNQVSKVKMGVEVNPQSTKR